MRDGLGTRIKRSPNLQYLRDMRIICTKPRAVQNTISGFAAWLAAPMQGVQAQLAMRYCVYQEYNVTFAAAGVVGVVGAVGGWRLVVGVGKNSPS